MYKSGQAIVWLAGPALPALENQQLQSIKGYALCEAI